MVMISPHPAIELERSDSPVELRRARADRVRFVDVPPASYLAVDGTEPAGSETYMNAIHTLFPVAHTLHDELRERGREEPVGMLEGLYWLAPEEVLAGEVPGTRSEEEYHWHWRLLIALPPLVSEVEVEAAIAEATRKRALPLADRLRVIHWEEGPAAQTLHVGSYDAETDTIKRLHAAITEAGYEPYGQHHEIYLNNPQQVGEDQAKTVLRRPIRALDESDGS
jgi:hypothetical protein